jgi:hypothetical protein
MPEIELYNSVRTEILINHVLMHVTTIVVIVLLLLGIWVTEHKRSVISVFLPILSVAWAAAVLRFDYLIQRQGTYLRTVEIRLREGGVSIPLWESWKSSLTSTRIVMPITDLLAVSVVVITTAYLLFAPAKALFVERSWPAHRLYSWSILAIVCGLLACLVFLPKVAAW